MVRCTQKRKIKIIADDRSYLVSTHHHRIGYVRSGHAVEGVIAYSYSAHSRRVTFIMGALEIIPNLRVCKKPLTIGTLAGSSWTIAVTTLPRRSQVPL